MNSNIDLIAHSKCGYSLKQVEAIKEQGKESEINVVYCDIPAEGEKDARCKKTKAFPTFYKNDKQIHVGYTKDLSEVYSKAK